MYLQNVLALKKGYLSLTVPEVSLLSSAIDVEVLNLKDKAPHGRRTGPHLMLKPAQGYEAGKRAYEYGVTASICYFAKKYFKLYL